MIESEKIKQLINQDILTWCDYVKATPLLRDGDIQVLVRTIVGEFYRVSLCCGHLVRSIYEGVLIEFYEYDDHSKGTVQGFYCKDCAEKYKNELGAWELIKEVT